MKVLAEREDVPALMEQGEPGIVQMVQLLRSLALKEGFSPSLLDGVQYLLATRPYRRAPAVYDPSIIIIAQGLKRGYLGNQVFTFDPCNYLVLSVSLPLECETEASAEEPLLGISIRVEPALLGELLLKMDIGQERFETVPRGIYATPLNAELISAANRLLACLGSPQECRILGPSIVREIVYWVLCGEQSGALRAVAARQSHTVRISRTLHRIHTEYHDSRLSVEALAREVHMSVSVFHHTFKAVTLTSPLQYLKSVRLHKARMLMLLDGANVSTASRKVGYESASQFSREFKRFFGRSPMCRFRRNRPNELT